MLLGGNLELEAVCEGAYDLCQGDRDFPDLFHTVFRGAGWCRHLSVALRDILAKSGRERPAGDYFVFISKTPVQLAGGGSSR
jgi:hypothetical protein